MKYHLLFFFSLPLLYTACKEEQKTSPVRKEIVDAVFASGHIENKDQYTIMANTDGYLQTAYVSEGDSVKKEQPLFVLSNEVQGTQVHNAETNLQYAQSNTTPQSPQTEQLQVQIEQAQDKAGVDSLNYKRYQRLAATQAVSKADFDNARIQYQASLTNLTVLQKNLADLQRSLNLNVANARDQLAIQKQTNNYNHIVCKAPGIVLTINKKKGDYVRKGDALAQIGAGLPIAKLLIDENDIQRVKEGQPVLISLNSNKSKIYKATVTKVYPSFDANQQSFVAEAAFMELPNELRNGTQLQSNIVIQDKKNALVIPSFYLQNGDSVLLKNKKEKTAVATGIHTLEWTEITGGIAEKDVLVLPK